MSRDALYLRHILDAIQKIERYAEVGHDEFLAESLRHDAVIRQIEIIGEAAKRLSPQVTGRSPDVPWRQVAGMRDVLIHNYMGVSDPPQPVGNRGLALCPCPVTPPGAGRSDGGAGRG